MTNILLTGVNTSLNNGGMAMALSVSGALREYIPDARFYILSNMPAKDTERYKPYNIEAFERPWKKNNIKNLKLLRIFSMMINASIITFQCILYRFIPEKVSRTSSKYTGMNRFFISDVIVDINGDSLTEDYGMPLETLFEISLGIIAKKPVVIYAQSIGPFRKKINRLFVRAVLNKVSLITIRDAISMDYIREFPISKPPIYLTADSAFLLKPADDKTVNKILKSEGIEIGNCPLIGISPSQIIYHYGFHNCGSPEEKYGNYISLMARITDYLIEELNANIIFISHVISDNNDDRRVSNDIYKLSKNKVNIKVISGEYAADEIKGIISRCDAFIGCRMHATIASTSLCIPTIAIAYSQKTHGIVGKMLEQENCVIDIRKGNYEDIYSQFLSKINFIWKNRTEIRENLNKNMGKIRERSSFNAELVRDLLQATP